VAACWPRFWCFDSPLRSYYCTDSFYLKRLCSVCASVLRTPQLVLVCQGECHHSKCLAESCHDYCCGSHYPTTLTFDSGYYLKVGRSLTLEALCCWIELTCSCSELFVSLCFGVSAREDPACYCQFGSPRLCAARSYALSRQYVTSASVASHLVLSNFDCYLVHGVKSWCLRSLAAALLTSQSI